MANVAELQPERQEWVRSTSEPSLAGAETSGDQGAAIDRLHRERGWSAAVWDAAGELVVVVDRQGRIVHLNRYCEQVTGYTCEEVRGKRFWDAFIPPQELEGVRSEFDKLPASGFSSHHEGYWLTRDGFRRRVTWSLTALADAEGAVEYIIGTGIDVTEQRQAEAARQESEALSRSMTENSVAVSRDVTERRTAEEALRAGDERLKALFDLLPIGVSILDEERRIVQDNAALHRILDLSRERLHAGADVRRQYLRPDGTPMPPEEFPSRRAVRENRPVQAQIGVLKEDGKVTWTEVSAVPVSIDEWRVIVTTTDVTRRKEAEEALRRTNDELERRVQERTQKLLESNRCLELEIGERRRVEEELRRSEQELEQRVEERTQDLAMLLEISNAAALSKELEPLLQRILEALEAVVGYVGATVYRLEGDALKAVMHRGPLPADEVKKLHLPVERSSLAHELLSTQKPISIPDVRADTPPAGALRQVAGERFNSLFGYVRSWLGVPLAVKGEMVGLVTLQRSDPGAFDERETTLTQAFAGQLAVAVENARLYQQAQELAALQERQFLARELHDAVSQTLFSASLAAEVLPRLWEEDRQSGLECLSEVRQLTRGALAEMRMLLLELRPMTLAQTELAALLQQLAEAASSRMRIPVVVDADRSCSLPADVRVALYRIAQEALNNVAKHAEACNVAVTLRSTPLDTPADPARPATRVVLSVADNGRGCDTTLAAPGGKGMGLGIMRERAEALGGAFAFASEAGKGTSVTVTWPAE